MFLNRAVHPAVRVRALEVLVCPVLLYNTGGWWPTRADLDCLHRVREQMSIQIVNQQMQSGVSWLDFLEANQKGDEHMEFDVHKTVG